MYFQELSTPESTAALQAAGGRVQLKRRVPKSIEGNALDPDGPEAMQGVAIPCIEMLADGSVLLTVHMQLRTGKVSPGVRFIVCGQLSHAAHSLARTCQAHWQ